MSMGEHNPPSYLVQSIRRDARGGEKWALVPIPSEPGRYVRCHPCVLEVACAQCGALLGEPCRREGVGCGSIIQIWHGRAVVIEPTRTRHRAAIHAVRRKAAGRRCRTACDGQEAESSRQTTMLLDQNGVLEAE